MTTRWTLLWSRWFCTRATCRGGVGTGEEAVCGGGEGAECGILGRGVVERKGERGRLKEREGEGCRGKETKWGRAREKSAEIAQHSHRLRRSPYCALPPRPQITGGQPLSIQTHSLCDHIYLQDALEMPCASPRAPRSARDSPQPAASLAPPDWTSRGRKLAVAAKSN